MTTFDIYLLPPFLGISFAGQITNAVFNGLAPLRRSLLAKDASADSI